MKRAIPTGSWPGDEATRAQAVFNFCKAVDKPGSLRDDCLDKTKTVARETLKKEGPYPNMPADVIVRAFEKDDESRGDDLVTFLLPPPGALPNPFLAETVWVCSYRDWGTGINGWAGDKARRTTAVKNFCEAIKVAGTGSLREECCDKNKNVAKDKLKELGPYPNMPDDVLVRVFEIDKVVNNEELGDMLVTIILPKAGTFPWPVFKAGDAWVCTYIQWNQLQ
jgi:hypothetical protein